MEVQGTWQILHVYELTFTTLENHRIDHAANELLNAHHEWSLVSQAFVARVDEAVALHDSRLPTNCN